MNKYLSLALIFTMLFAVNAECTENKHDEYACKIGVVNGNIVNVCIKTAALSINMIPNTQNDYVIDLKGEDFAFKNVKTTYKAGEQVVIYYDMIATDTNYTFYVDGQIYNPDYESDKGYIISFTMPEHDVAVEVESKNTMLIYNEW